MTAFHWLRPAWLLALPPLLAGLVWLWRRRRQSRSWQAVCDPALLPHLLLGEPRRQGRGPFWLLACGLLLAVLALAGPAWRQQPLPLFRQQSALVILFDLSRSMAAADLKPDRLERARLKIEDLLRQRREGQTALIAFAGDAFTVTPLTDDVQTISALLGSLDPDLMPVQGSEPQRAIRLGVELLQHAGLQQGWLLLVSDEDRPGRAVAAAGEARRAGYVLEVLGVGTVEGASVPLPGGGVLRDYRGNTVLPKLEETGLRELATAGGGDYRRLTIDDSDLQGLLTGMDQHRFDRAQPLAGKTGSTWREEGVWLLLPLALLASLGFRRGWLLLLLAMLLPAEPAGALTWQDLWQRPDQQAASAFAAGQYAQAQQLFEDARWKASSLYRAGQFEAAAKTLEHPETADDWYNRGNALARTGRYDQALQAYRQALALKPDHADAKFNSNVVEDALHRQQQSQQQQGRQQGQQQNRQDFASRKDQSSQGDTRQNRQGQSQAGSDADKQQQSSSREPSQQTQRDAATSQPSDSVGRDGSGREQHNDAARMADQPGSMSAAEGTPERDGRQPQSAATATAGDRLPDKEQDRLVRQWLQRIPDDPGGLLRRKFLYQYRQRGRQLETDRPW